MSTWGKVILTKQGEALLNQCLGMSGHYNLNQSNDPDSDTKGIVITRVSTGRYRYTNTSVEYLKERTDLATSDGATGGTSGFVENLNITGLKPVTSSNSDQYGQALIQVQLDNQREDRNIKEEYPLGQLGVFARLEGSTEEILFTIVQYAGDTLPVIPAPVTPTLLNFGFYIAIATTETISIEMEFTGIVTAKQFDDYKLVTDETLNTLNEHTKNTENPHKVTAQQVGLGNVPNVTTNNQTPTFTAASSRTNINSGETLATIFGKIKKWFSDLKTIAFTGSYTDLLNKPTSMQNPNSLTLTMNGSSSSYDGSATASKSWYAPTSGGTAGYNLISNGSGAPVWQQPPYAVCSTSSGTGAKTVSITNFKLVTGTRVSVKFSNKTSTTPTLNVSSTGAKEIKLVQTNGTYVSVNSYNSWSAGEIVELIYDGTYWVAVSSNMRFVSGAQSATVIVGTTYSSGYCDYRCDGSNDVSIINTAIQDAYSRLYKNDSDYTGVAYPNLGVKVFFKAGVYKVNGNIYTGNTAWVSNNNYITLEGESENAVTFVKTTDNSHSLIDATDISFVFKNINFHFAQVASTEIKCSGVSFYDCNITLRTAGYSGDSFTFIVAHNSDNGVVRMNGGSFTFITVSGWTPCITGIDCYGVDIHNCNIQLKNGANSNNIPSGDSLELNFIYQTQSNATRGTYPNIMSHCTFKCSGNTSIIASTEISITESEITLADKSSKISHYATSSSQTLRNIFANNRVHSTGSYVYMRFGVITCNSFGRADTYGSVSSSYSYYLYNEVCCSITGNFFVGSWSLYLGSRNATVTGNMYKGSLSKSSTSTGTVTMANNVAAN